MPKIDTPIMADAQSLTKVTSTALPTLLVLSQGKNDSPDWENALKTLAKTEAGQLLVVKVNMSENYKLTQFYDLSQGHPLVVGLKNGNELARYIQPSTELLGQVVDYLLDRRADLPTVAPKSTAPAKPIPVTDENFTQKVLQSELPILVDFWATWCPPCRMIAPSLEKLSGEFAGKVTIAKLDVDNNPMTSRQYKVQSIPTLLLFKNGEVVDKVVGAVPEAALRQFLQRHS